MSTKSGVSALTDDNKENLFALLRVKAQEKGFTALANETGIPRTHLYTIFSPEGNPSVETLLKLAKALGVKIQLSTTESA